MHTQMDINCKMRAILIDWIVEVHLKFKLADPTLYLTCHIIDRFCMQENVHRSKLQLVGVTALLIACKYEEIFPTEVHHNPSAVHTRFCAAVGLFYVLLLSVGSTDCSKLCGFVFIFIVHVFWLSEPSIRRNNFFGSTRNTTVSMYIAELCLVGVTTFVMVHLHAPTRPPPCSGNSVTSVGMHFTRDLCRSVLYGGSRPLLSTTNRSYKRSATHEAEEVR